MFMCLLQSTCTKDEYSYATPVDSISRPKVGRQGGRVERGGGNGAEGREGGGKGREGGRD